MFANIILLRYASHSVNTGQDCSDDVCLLSKKRKKNECEMTLVAWKSVALVHQWSFCRLLCLVLLLFSMLFYIKRHTEHKNCVTAEEMIVYFLSGLSHELFSWCLEANLCLNYPLRAQAVLANVLKKMNSKSLISLRATIYPLPNKHLRAQFIRSPILEFMNYEKLWKCL